MNTEGFDSLLLTALLAANAIVFAFSAVFAFESYREKEIRRLGLGFVGS